MLLPTTRHPHRQNRPPGLPPSRRPVGRAAPRLRTGSSPEYLLPAVQSDGKAALHLGVEVRDETNLTVENPSRSSRGACPSGPPRIHHSLAPLSSFLPSFSLTPFSENSEDAAARREGLPTPSARGRRPCEPLLFRSDAGERSPPRMVRRELRRLAVSWQTLPPTTHDRRQRLPRLYVLPWGPFTAIAD